ncbi:hypothetical protein GGR49_003772 [Sphingomonas carotinifaciens]|nr:hypothetical protein [Sphingomonas carotinifaciens]
MLADAALKKSQADLHAANENSETARRGTHRRT